MKSSFKKRFINWGLTISLVLIGLLIIIFNDVFGHSELFGMLAFVYFALLFFLFCRWIFKQIKSILKLKNEKAKTELQHLKSQVNPHFFFNMLNNLYGLVEKDSKKAQELILKLSDMMRYSIYEGEKDVVTIAEEIEYLENYISLHKMRYHKEIEVYFNVKVEDQNQEVLPLLFIILLENAFKHGVENLRENAFVKIDLTTTAHTLDFKVENNFDLSETAIENGIGLKNLRRRLELVYPDNHSLTLSEVGAIFTAHLYINQL